VNATANDRGQAQTALVSIGAAIVLVALKLGTGLLTGSLALVSAGIESSGDVVAAIFTFLAIRLGGRPADREHPYGHRRAENLAALAEAAILIGGAIVVVVEAVGRLTAGGETFEPRWYVFVVIVIALAIDVSRVLVSVRSAAKYKSAALRSNAFHFGGDMAGSLAVLAGLVAVAAGFHAGDAIASLLVAAIIVAAAGRLIYENARVLMDTTPAEAQADAEAAISDLPDDVELRQLRVRESGGQYFADATIGAAPDQALVASHGVADRVEAAVRQALPDSDVVVHVEPRREGLDLRARALAVALAEPAVHEVHNVAIYQRGQRSSLSMHLKLDADMPLRDAHEVASRIERRLQRKEAVDEVHTHLEPLEAPIEVETAVDAPRGGPIAELVRRRTGRGPGELKLLISPLGLVVFLDVILDAETSLAEAHDLARLIEQEIRDSQPDIADVIVHTEP